MRRRLGWPILILLLVVLAFASRVPTDLDAVAYTVAPSVDRDGVWTPNSALAEGPETFALAATGPEDVEVLADGRVCTGVHGGRILCRGTDDEEFSTLATLGGRPLGLDLGPDGALWAAVADVGLVRVQADGSFGVMCPHSDQTNLRLADDVAVGPDGVVWFTNASTRYPMDEWKTDLLSGRSHGGVHRYDPATDQCTQVADGLAFANGIAVDPGGRFVLVSETGRYRVHRYPIVGDRLGERELWLDGLPGFPDGVSADGDRFWIALASPRIPMVDALSQWPAIRSWLTALPKALQPAPARHAWVVAVSPDGEVLQSLEDPLGTHIATITSVQARPPWLYFGSLSSTAVARIPLPGDGRTTRTEESTMH